MIDAVDVFKAFQSHRGDAIITTSGTVGSHWATVSTEPNRDLRLGSSMGQTVSAAFGVALGLPEEKMVLFDSEGALLMNLGALASIAGKAPKKLLSLSTGQRDVRHYRRSARSQR